MKLLLLKILLQRRARDEGFTLPMVIALGLVMLLLGAINLTSANEENLNAITQNSRSDALAIAEIGVTRYRELLDRNRLLTLYDAPASGTNEWLGLTQICDGDIASFFPGQSNSVTIAENGLELNNDGDTTDTFPTGSYSLVSYDYNLTSGSFDQTDDANNVDGSGIGATGTLTVKGETPDGNEAQIEVDIPIRINQQDMGNLAPALWIGDETITATDIGNLNITGGNLVIQDSAVTTSGSEADGCGDFSTLATSTGLDIISDPRSLPSIQPVINTITAARAVTGGDRTNTSIPGDGIVGDTNADNYVDPPVGVPFDESVHCANIRDCRYYYYFTSNPNINSNVKADGIAAVTFYVNSPLSIDATTGSIEIGSDVASNYFEIYVDNGNGITIDTGSGNTVNIDAFIHAPQSTLTVTGTGTVNIDGSVWVNDFANDTNATVNITPDTSNISSTVSSAAYEFYTTTTNRTQKPLTNSPTNWKTEEVTP